jgi:hypothetical protein
MQQVSCISKHAIFSLSVTTIQLQPSGHASQPMKLGSIFKTNAITFNNAGICPFIYHSEFSLEDMTTKQHKYIYFTQIQFILTDYRFVQCGLDYVLYYPFL